MKELKPITKVNRPFQKWVQKTIPLIFDESLSYYEQLCSFMAYLDNVMVALNENGEAIIELQELYVELKEYVDNYFTSLDVQEEINNKLDQMAEDGELAEIIVQYLQIASILAFNTVLDMKNGTNLTNGSFVRTYSENGINDGKGEFYKIRPITSNDVVDEINIIALNNSSTLIAELMQDYYNKELMDTINYNYTTLDEKINTNSDNIGDLEELKTMNKDNLVNAINENKQDLDEYKVEISDEFDLVNIKMNKNSSNYQSYQNIAHRGLSATAPENTLPAINKAGIIDCYGIEIDVQCTSDNEFILMHDLTVDRTTNGTGTVNNMTLAQINNLTIDAGNRFIYYPNTKVPTLKEALLLAKKYNLHVQIELKATWSIENLNKLIDLIYKLRYEKNITIISFDVAHINSLRELNKELKLTTLYGGELTQSVLNWALSVDSGISLSYTSNTIIPQIYRDFMVENNMEFGFYTVNNINDVKAVINNNPECNFIVSDYGYGRETNKSRSIVLIVSGGELKTWVQAQVDTSRTPGQPAYYDTGNVSVSNNIYSFSLDIPIYKEINIFNLVGNLEGAGVYDVWLSTQSSNGFNIRFINKTTGDLVSVNDLFGAVGEKYINITFN